MRKPESLILHEKTRKSHLEWENRKVSSCMRKQESLILNEKTGKSHSAWEKWKVSSCIRNQKVLPLISLILKAIQRPTDSQRPSKTPKDPQNSPKRHPGKPKDAKGPPKTLRGAKNVQRPPEMPTMARQMSNVLWNLPYYPLAVM